MKPWPHATVIQNRSYMVVMAPTQNIAWSLSTLFFWITSACSDQQFLFHILNLITSIDLLPSLQATHLYIPQVVQYVTCKNASVALFLTARNLCWSFVVGFWNADFGTSVTCQACSSLRVYISNFRRTFPPCKHQLNWKGLQQRILNFRLIIFLIAILAHYPYVVYSSGFRRVKVDGRTEGKGRTWRPGFLSLPPFRMRSAKAKLAWWRL